jgi:predicted ribosome quality control (RQC) complex YloA/Tae2 family protein
MPGKTRFTVSDVRAMVVEMRLLIGQRAANVYDLNDKTYLIKFAVPGEAEKPILLIESGVRFHLTKYARDKNDMPSPFTMKLRKNIRTKRLEDVKQLASDRVVDFKFGSGDATVHIILELYGRSLDLNYMQ